MTTLLITFKPCPINATKMPHFLTASNVCYLFTTFCHYERDNVAMLGFSFNNITYRPVIPTGTSRFVYISITVLRPKVITFTSHSSLIKEVTLAFNVSSSACHLLESLKMHWINNALSLILTHILCILMPFIQHTTVHRDLIPNYR